MARKRPDLLAPSKFIVFCIAAFSAAFTPISERMQICQSATSRKNAALVSGGIGLM